MAKGQDFEGEMMPISEERKRVSQKEPESGYHTSVIVLDNQRQSIIFRPDGLSATHRPGWRKLAKELEARLPRQYKLNHEAYPDDLTGPDCD